MEIIENDDFDDSFYELTTEIDNEINFQKISINELENFNIDLKKIAKFIKENDGLCGILTFYLDESLYRFNFVKKIDTKHCESETEKKIENEEIKVINISKENKNIVKKSNILNIKNESVVIQENKIYEKTTSNFNNEKYKNTIIMIDLKNKTRKIISDNNTFLKEIEKKYEINKEICKNLFYQVGENKNKLISFLNSENKDLLWSEEFDKIILNLKEYINDNNFENLIASKNYKEMKERLEFLLNKK